LLKLFISTKNKLIGLTIGCDIKNDIGVANEILVKFVMMELNLKFNLRTSLLFFLFLKQTYYIRQTIKVQEPYLFGYWECYKEGNYQPKTYWAPVWPI
jgi:hypothetical protein